MDATANLSTRVTFTKLTDPRYSANTSYAVMLDGTSVGTVRRMPAGTWECYVVGGTLTVDRTRGATALRAVESALDLGDLTLLRSLGRTLEPGRLDGGAR